MHPLLIELGTEELPVKALPGLAQAFFDGVLSGLEKRGIAVTRGDAKPLSTPRRLAVLLPGVATEQPEQRSEVLGPYLNIALDAAGQPTKALAGFAAKAGIDWTALERTSDAKGERFVHRAVTPGAQTAALLPEILREAIAAMPIPKPMRWGAHEYAFARPVQWLVLLFGTEVIPAELLGVRGDRVTRGHRFMHEGPVSLAAPGDYVDALRAAHVLVDPDARHTRIVEEVEAAAKQAGGSARIGDDNLEQVVNLVEWPSAVLCSFERDFLAVPQEALIETMEINQKFFPVLDDGGKLTEQFIGIANIVSKDVAEVAKGYERVIRPRFADAKFFFDEDLKQGLEAMVLVWPASPIRPSWVRWPTRWRAWRRWPRRSRRKSVPIRCRRVGLRSWPRTTCNRAWSTNSRNCRALPGVITPRPQASRARFRLPSTRPTSRGLPATISHCRRWARCWRLPSGWIRWPVGLRPG
jgi:glycyl-tRNA synthetase beta chain